MAAPPLDAAHVQLIARISFFAFVFLQAPCLVMETAKVANGVAMVAPLQLSMAALVVRLPEAVEFAHLMLFPGTWVRPFPLLRCLLPAHAGRCQC
jgi:hypothetical protein